MKRIVLLVIGCVFSINSFAQGTATDFSVADCSGSTRSLFSELDAGKIIVLGWTMPCSSCAGPLLDVHNAVLNYAISHPGVVEYWVADDQANTACPTVVNWCNSNGITNVASHFSNSAIDMLDYESIGMPKVVVLGCTSHKVYYNKNGNPSGAEVTNAIEAALSDLAASCQLGAEELQTANFDLNCFPNPASSSMKVSFTHESSDDLVIEIYSLNGTLLKNIALEKSNNEKQEIEVNIDDLTSGFYLLKLVDGNSSEITKIQVAR